MKERGREGREEERGKRERRRDLSEELIRARVIKDIAGIKMVDEVEAAERVVGNVPAHRRLQGLPHLCPRGLLPQGLPRVHPRGLLLLFVHKVYPSPCFPCLGPSCWQGELLWSVYAHNLHHFFSCWSSFLPSSLSLPFSLVFSHFDLFFALSFSSMDDLFFPTFSSSLSLLFPSLSSFSLFLSLLLASSLQKT